MEIQKSMISKSKINAKKLLFLSSNVVKHPEVKMSPHFILIKGEKLQDLPLGKNWYVILPLKEQESYLKFKLYLLQHISQKFKPLFQMSLLHASEVTPPAM